MTEAQKKWRVANRDRQREYNRAWRKKNPEKWAAIIKRYYHAHKEAIAAKRRENAARD